MIGRAGLGRSATSGCRESVMHSQDAAAASHHGRQDSDAKDI